METERRQRPAIDHALVVRRDRQRRGTDRQCPRGVADRVVCVRRLAGRDRVAPHVTCGGSRGKHGQCIRRRVAVDEARVVETERRQRLAINHALVVRRDRQRRGTDRKRPRGVADRVVCVRRLAGRDRVAPRVTCGGSRRKHGQGVYGRVAVDEARVVETERRQRPAVNHALVVRRDRQRRGADRKRPILVTDEVVGVRRLAGRDRVAPRVTCGGSRGKHGQGVYGRVAVDEARVVETERRQRPAVNHALVVRRDRQRRGTDRKRPRGVADRVVGVRRLAGRDRVAPRVTRGGGRGKHGQGVYGRVAVDEARVVETERRQRPAVNHALVVRRDRQRRDTDRKRPILVTDEVVGVRRLAGRDRVAPRVTCGGSRRKHGQGVYGRVAVDEARVVETERRQRPAVNHALVVRRDRQRGRGDGQSVGRRGHGVINGVAGTVVSQAYGVQAGVQARYRPACYAAGVGCLRVVRGDVERIRECQAQGLARQRRLVRE